MPTQGSGGPGDDAPGARTTGKSRLVGPGGRYHSDRDATVGARRFQECTAQAAQAAQATTGEATPDRGERGARSRNNMRNRKRQREAGLRGAQEP